MFERLRMQEVKQIIFSVPQGAIIPGHESLKVGDPIMIINKPNTSDLTFLSRTRFNDSAKGLVNLTANTSTIDFTINDGSVLFSLWSYLHGSVIKNTTDTLPFVEEVESDEDTIVLTNVPTRVTLYKMVDGLLQYIPTTQYSCTNNVISLSFTSDQEEYKAVYNYSKTVNSISYINQLHNSILCTVDIIIDAVDLNTNNKHDIYVHVDKAQIDTDLKLFLNDSAKASFTPIKIYAIPEGNGNKQVAKITVV